MFVYSGHDIFQQSPLLVLRPNKKVLPTTQLLRRTAPQPPICHLHIIHTHHSHSHIDPCRWKFDSIPKGDKLGIEKRVRDVKYGAVPVVLARRAALPGQPSTLLKTPKTFHTSKVSPSPFSKLTLSARGTFSALVQSSPVPGDTPPALCSIFSPF